MAGLADWDEGSAYFEKFSLIFSSSLFVIEKKISILKYPCAFINYLITESEVVKGKSQTEALPYWLSNGKVNTGGWGLRFSSNDRTVEVIKLFIIWHKNKK